MSDVSKVLRDYRLRSGLSQEEISRRTGISQSYLSRLERGKISGLRGLQTVLTALRAVDCPESVIRKTLGL